MKNTPQNRSTLSSVFKALAFVSMFFAVTACNEQSIETQRGTGSIAPSIVWVSSAEQSVQSNSQLSPLFTSQQQISAVKLSNTVQPNTVQASTSQPKTANPRAIQVGPGTTLPSDLATVRLEVTGSDISTPISKDFPAADRSGTLTGVPVGSNRTVTVQGLNNSNDVIYEGMVNNVSVTTGTTTPVSITAIELVNQPPTANAGIDQTVQSGTLVIHTGIGNDTGGTIESFNWVQLSGTTINFLDSSNNTDTMRFLAPIVSVNEILTFQLTVVDDSGALATDDVTITVTSIANANPTADAGANEIVVSGDTVNLSGSGSDTDGTVTAFNWSQVSGTNVSITNNTETLASFIAPNVTSSADLTFRLTVTDNGGAIATDDVTITVTPPPNTDITAPSAAITFPPTFSATDGRNIIVRGTATDASEITVVRVNGVDANSSDNFASWEASVALNNGINNLTVETADEHNNMNMMAYNVEVNVQGLSNHHPNSANVFLDPLFVSLDEANNQALVIDDNEKALLAVDLNTGVRTILSDCSTPNAGNAFSSPRGMILDSENNRVLVTDTNLDALLAVDLNTGVCTVISNDSNAGLGFVTPRGIALDAVNNRALVVDNGRRALMAVNLTTGARTIISDDGTPNSVNAFSFPFDVVLDSSNNRALVIDSNSRALLAVNLSSGARTIISNNSTPSTSNQFMTPRGMTLDDINNVVLVVDPDLEALLEVDLSTGARTIISNNSTPNNDNSFSFPFGVDIDNSNDTVLVVDPDLDALIAVDLVNGQRVIVSR